MKDKNIRKIKIAIIQQSPDMGGAETFMLSLINNLRLNGHEIKIATNKGKFYQILKKEGLHPFVIPVTLDVIGNIRGLIKSCIFFPSALFYYLNLLRELRNQDTQIILMSGFSEKMLVTFLSSFFKIKVIWIEYGPLRTIFPRNFYLPKLLYSLLAGFAEKIIVPSNNTKKDLIKNLKLRDSVFSMIPCGVDLTLNKYKDRRRKSTVIIGNVSRVVTEKGQGYLIDVIPAIVDKNKNARFVFVGEGPAKNHFMSRVRQLKIGKYVRFYGYVENVEEKFSNFDIFVFPSDWELEGFGLVAVEAMKYKIPVVGNNLGPLKEILGEGAGVLVDVKNKKQFIKVLDDLIKNKKKRKELGGKGYQKAIRSYDIRKTTVAYESIFYSVLDTE